MNNNKKSHKLNNLSSPPPPTKLKIITNGNGMTAVPVNGKVRARQSKTNATDAMDVFTFVSFKHVQLHSFSNECLRFCID